MKLLLLRQQQKQHHPVHLTAAEPITNGSDHLRKKTMTKNVRLKDVEYHYKKTRLRSNITLSMYIKVMSVVCVQPVISLLAFMFLRVLPKCTDYHLTVWRMVLSVITQVFRLL